MDGQLTEAGHRTERMAAVPSFADLLRLFARIGCLSFGGPAGQIALMHREIVEQRGWLDEEQFLHALNFCHLLPGPEAQQLATWIGWRWHGVRGGLAAGMLFVIPGSLVILALSVFYSVAAGLAWVAALFLGIKAAVLAIVGQAVLRIARRSLNSPLKRGIAVSVFIALFALNLPFPLVVLATGLLGFAVAQSHPEWLKLGTDSPAPPDAPRPWGATARAVAIGGALWAARRGSGHYRNGCRRHDCPRLPPLCRGWRLRWQRHRQRGDPVRPASACPRPVGAAHARMPTRHRGCVPRPKLAAAGQDGHAGRASRRHRRPVAGYIARRDKSRRSGCNSAPHCQPCAGRNCRKVGRRRGHKYPREWPHHRRIRQENR